MNKHIQIVVFVLMYNHFDRMKKIEHNYSIGQEVVL